MRKVRDICRVPFYVQEVLESDMISFPNYANYNKFLLEVLVKTAGNEKFGKKFREAKLCVKAEEDNNNDNSFSDKPLMVSVNLQELCAEICELMRRMTRKADEENVESLIINAYREAKGWSKKNKNIEGIKEIGELRFNTPKNTNQYDKFREKLTERILGVLGQGLDVKLSRLGMKTIRELGCVLYKYEKNSIKRQIKQFNKTNDQQAYEKKIAQKMGLSIDEWNYKNGDVIKISDKEGKLYSNFKDIIDNINTIDEKGLTYIAFQRIIFRYYASCSFVEREKIMLQELLLKIEKISVMPEKITFQRYNSDSFDIIAPKLKSSTNMDELYIFGVDDQEKHIEVRLREIIFPKKVCAKGCKSKGKEDTNDSENMNRQFEKSADYKVVVKNQDLLLKIRLERYNRPNFRVDKITKDGDISIKAYGIKSEIESYMNQLVDLLNEEQNTKMQNQTNEMNKTSENYWEIQKCP